MNTYVERERGDCTVYFSLMHADIYLYFIVAPKPSRSYGEVELVLVEKISNVRISVYSHVLVEQPMHRRSGEIPPRMNVFDPTETQTHTVMGQVVSSQGPTPLG